MPSFQKQCLSRAVKLADWFVFNQCKSGGDANRGRYAVGIQVRRGKAVKSIYTTNWTTGMTVISMLMAWRRTGDEAYLKSAQLGGEYLKSLQVMDAQNRKAYGLIRESTPQTSMCHPRDALSAAWALLHLGMFTKDKEALRRSKIFAEWFRSHAVKNRYPAWSAFTDGRKPYWQLGSFHGGSPLYLFDLYKKTRDERWLKTGLGICDRWMQLFPKKDGSIRIEIDPKNGRDLTGRGPDDAHNNWQYMHLYNDDFTSLALMRAYLLTKKAKYLKAVTTYMDWILSEQRDNGAFGNPSVASAAASLVIELLDVYRITRDRKYAYACDRSIDYFLDLQELKSRDKAVRGGFYGVTPDYEHETRSWMQARVSCYALAALLKLEGGEKYVGYTS